jgi:hypothetical protein
MGSIVLSESDVTVPQIARNLGLSRQAVQRVANDLNAQWANKAFAGLPPAQLREAITLLEALDALCRDYLDTPSSPMAGKRND